MQNNFEFDHKLWVEVMLFEELRFRYQICKKSRFFFRFQIFVLISQLHDSVTQLTRSVSRAGFLSWQGFKLSSSK